MGAPEFFDAATNTEVHGPAIANVPTDTPDAAANAAAINAILAALRSANIISTS